MIALLPDTVEKLEHAIYGDEKKCDGQGKHGAAIMFTTRSNTSLTSTLFEFFQSDSSQSSDLSRSSARRITWAQREAMVDSDSANLALVNSSGVIAPRRWRSEGVNGLAGSAIPGKRLEGTSHANRHGVADINSYYFLPADNHFVEGIDDGDALIKDDHSRSHEDQISSRAEQGRPEGRSDAACERVVHETLAGVDEASNKGDGSEDKTASWSKDLGVGHALIFSRGGNS